MKVVRLLPKSVPEFWDAIKFAASKADRIKENELPGYLRELLVALLNDKAQCFVRVSDDRELLGIMITRISLDEVTKERILFINCIYSFKGVSQEQWVKDLDIIKKFANSTECKRLIMYSTIPRVYEIAEGVGFTERYRCFTYDIDS